MVDFARAHISPEVFQHMKGRLQKLGMSVDDLTIQPDGMPLTIEQVDEIIDSMEKQIEEHQSKSKTYLIT